MNITWLPPRPEPPPGVALGKATFYGERRVARKMYLDGFQTRDDYRMMLSTTIALERGLITLAEAYECLRWTPLRVAGEHA